ncbi:sensor histidine kinase [Streptomyces sp. NPDC001002]
MRSGRKGWPGRCVAAVRRRLVSTRLRTRLVLSHLGVLVVAVVAMTVAAWCRTPNEFERAIRGRDGSHAESVSRNVVDAFGDSMLVTLVVGLVVAVLFAGALSQVLLTPLDRVRSAVRHLAAGRYGECVELPGEPGLTALVRDVNQLAAALADIERRRARLVSEVAHEMRTPLATLRGQIDGIADGVFQPDQAMLASLLEDLDRLQRLAEDLSQLSRIEEGAFALRPERTDVSQVVRRSVERLRPQFVEGGVDLCVTPADRTVAELDTDRLAQVVTNLVGNALAATPPGGRVTVGVRADGEEVAVAVSDTGIGLAPDDLERIFARFERVEHPGRAVPASGSGIGLTIARGIARGHGGDIRAMSDGLGLGACFEVRLPRRLTTAHASRNQDPRAQGALPRTDRCGPSQTPNSPC